MKRALVAGFTVFYKTMSLMKGFIKKKVDKKKRSKYIQQHIVCCLY